MTSTTKTSKQSENPVWFITGCSTGLGRQIAQHVLKLEYRVVVTSRDPKDVQDLAELGDALILKLDATGRSANETKHPIADYANTADKNIRQLRAVSGNQDGDPVRAAEAIVQAVESQNPPHRLLLGNDAYEGAIAELDELREEFTAWESVSRGADFPDATPAVIT